MRLKWVHFIAGVTLGFASLHHLPYDLSALQALKRPLHVKPSILCHGGHAMARPYAIHNSATF
jgi:hypothetical protein